MKDRFCCVGTCSSTHQDITICYQTFGSTSDPCLLLVSGLGSTCLTWRDELCEDLSSRGLYVVRFDNRDVGLSSQLDRLPAPSLFRVFAHSLFPARFCKPPHYTVEDMAADALKLLSCLGIQRAHVLGASMGGMIAQRMALMASTRVASLTLLSSDCRGLGLRELASDTFFCLVTNCPSRAGLDDAIVLKVRHARRFCGGYPLDVDAYVVHSLRNAHRGTGDSAGKWRQLWATQGTPSCESRLRRMTGIPTLIMHGMRDEVIPYSRAMHLAMVVRDSKLIMYPQMGHSLPSVLYADVCNQVCMHVLSSATSLSSP